MPGIRSYGFRMGDNAELLAEFVISRLSFTSKVPRTEDVGHDFICSLAEREGRIFKAGPFFTVQAKSNNTPISYQKDYEIEWIKNQENPFFICIANRDSLSVEIFSTWPLLLGILHKAAKQIILIPGNETNNFKQPETENDLSEQRIYLGKPILRISANELTDDEKISYYASILRQWIEIDRENIVNRYAGMYWVIGPTEYETNKAVQDNSHPAIAFLWNAENIEKCKINFGRSSTSLRLVLRKAFGSQQNEENNPKLKTIIKDLEQVLASCGEWLEPAAKKILFDEIGLKIK